MFYKFNHLTNKYVKIVPTNINDLMDPIVLAYLIQGDGNFDQSRNRVSPSPPPIQPPREWGLNGGWGRRG